METEHSGALALENKTLNGRMEKVEKKVFRFNVMILCTKVVIVVFPSQRQKVSRGKNLYKKYP